MNKKVLVTIDTEGHDGDDPVVHLILGKTKNNQFYGIDYIMDLLEEYDIKGLFFVDMAEAWSYGKDKISDVVKKIIVRGHDVGVHIHPDHMADPRRLFLWEYTKEEQFRIIEKCTKLYEEIVGVRPLAFRAGKYGANRDTLDILTEMGYKYDFSEFYGQKWCGIEPPVTENRTVLYKEQLLEIPVSSYRSFTCFNYNRCDKIDADMCYKEFKEITGKMLKEEEMDIFVMFIHSFSLLKWRRNPNNPKVSNRNIKKLKKMLNYIAQIEQVEYSFLEDIHLKDYKDNKKKNKVFDYSSALMSYFYFIVRSCKVIGMRLKIGT